MEHPEIGWIAAIIIGGIAGWLAEQFMKSNMGLLMNVVLGIVGAAIASAIFSYFGVALGGWIGYLIAGFIGACLLIWIVRALRAPLREDARRVNRSPIVAAGAALCLGRPVGADRGSACATSPEAIERSDQLDAGRPNGVRRKEKDRPGMRIWRPGDED